LATSQILGLLVCDIVAAFASIGVAFYFSWKITLVLLATLPVAGIILSLASRPCEPAIQRQRAQLATASKLAIASLLGIDLVKVFGGYKTDLRHYADAIRRSSKPFHVQAACNSFQMGFVVFWVFGLFIIGFWFGLSLVEKGMSPGNVLTTFYATLAAFQGFESLMPHWLVLAKGMSAGGFLAAIVSDSRRGEKKIWKMGRTARPTVVFGDIKLTNVRCMLVLPFFPFALLLTWNSSGQFRIPFKPQEPRPE
jgi:ATP-binding cassette subfamily B (MDR/TAP) protein 1